VFSADAYYVTEKIKLWSDAAQNAQRMIIFYVLPFHTPGLFQMTSQNVS